MKLSELFAPGKNTLIAYNFMFPRHPNDDRPGPTEGATAKLKRGDGPCPSCVVFLDTLDGAAEHLEAAFRSSEMLYAPPDAGQDPRHSGTVESLWNFMDLAPEGRPSDWHEQLSYGSSQPGAPAGQAASG